MKPRTAVPPTKMATKDTRRPDLKGGERPEAEVEQQLDDVWFNARDVATGRVDDVTVQQAAEGGR